MKISSSDHYGVVMVTTPSSILPPSLQGLLDSLPELNASDRDLIDRAYRTAERAHAGQLRKSGEPYITHPVAVAQILADMKLDAEAIAAALMHDVAEDTATTIDVLREEFGNTVALLVDGVTKLEKLPIPTNEPKPKSRTPDRNKEAIRKMMLMIDTDVRVVLIKLADRLHNMRTLGFMKPEKQIDIAQETLDIYAPLANRLGIWQLKWELEDLSFRYLQPEEYKRLASSLDERRTDRESYMQDVIDKLRQELFANDITEFHITGRPKHIYSIYRKMERKETSFELIFDVRAVRVIVKTVAECYHVLGVVHNLWRPVNGEFDDYIAAPKDNFYRSLHTAVRDNNGKNIEVQIRTWEMHEHAEYGIAAHWRYKEGNTGKRDKMFEERLTWIRRMMEFGSETDDANEFVNKMKSDMLQDRVMVYTPKGDVIDLPAGATPLDFAYHVHTDVGHRCRGAKVNGRLVTLTYQLQMGDQIEIQTSSRGGPSRDWLNPHLGYTTTNRAQEKIRTWFRKQNRDSNILEGREVLEREMRRVNAGDVSFETIATLLKYNKVDDCLAAIGDGTINNAQITNALIQEVQRRQRESEAETAALIRKRTVSATVVDSSEGISVMGAKGLMVNFAKCCSPTVGDEIVGFVTRGRGVTVHRKNCPNIQALPNKERFVEVNWGRKGTERRYTVPIEVIAYDRPGLLKDVSTLVADQKINIADLSIKLRNDVAVIDVILEISDTDQLASILTKLGNIKDVVEARRKGTA
jgi:GTP diphosphokinase / guanosine-3',5'-bis(diphosphate) 3'-diphosphatase